MILAVTGATGFVGTRLVAQAIAAGHTVRALIRQDQQAMPGVTWIRGSLEDQTSLSALATGADAVIHVAGVVNAPGPAGFEAGNVVGTGAMLLAAQTADVARFVHVSSLAAREPGLSDYGASKARSEALVAAASIAASIVRPPAVYGPGDREMLELFKMARGGQIFMPPRGHASYIHVDDLAALLLAEASPDASSKQPIEPDDGHPGGWSHRAFGAALAAAVGNPQARVIQTPAWLLRLAARGDRLLRGSAAKLTVDRVRYFCHSDWVVDPARAVPSEVWRPSIPTPDGLRDTAAWYRQNGWL